MSSVEVATIFPVILGAIGDSNDSRLTFYVNRFSKEGGKLKRFKGMALFRALGFTGLGFRGQSSGFGRTVQRFNLYRYFRPSKQSETYAAVWRAVTSRIVRNV